MHASDDPRDNLSCVRLQNSVSMARKTQPWQNTAGKTKQQKTCESLVKSTDQNTFAADIFDRQSALIDNTVNVTVIYSFVKGGKLIKK